MTDTTPTAVEPASAYDFSATAPTTYTDDITYRAALRSAFFMEVDATDELDYDDNAIKRGLDMIFEKTEKHPIFAELYKTAAATMMSEELDIGLAILFSYDYFAAFHLCLRTFFRGDGELATAVVAEELRKMLL